MPLKIRQPLVVMVVDCISLSFYFSSRCPFIIIIIIIVLLLYLHPYVYIAFWSLFCIFCFPFSCSIFRSLPTFSFHCVNSSMSFHLHPHLWFLFHFDMLQFLASLLEFQCCYLCFPVLHFPNLKDRPKLLAEISWQWPLKDPTNKY